MGARQRAGCCPARHGSAVSPDRGRHAETDLVP